MISEELLEEARKLVGNDRHEDYGDKLKNHQNIAKLWSAYLDVKISAHDVAICMGLLKIARLKHAHKKDSYLDLAAYAAIAGEIEERTGGESIVFHVFSPVLCCNFPIVEL